jgi:hypothetical protein
LGKWIIAAHGLMRLLETHWGSWRDFSKHGEWIVQEVTKQ